VVWSASLLLALFALYHWIESPAIVPSRKKKKMPLLWIEPSTSRNRIGCGTRSELQSGALPGELKRRRPHE
jgi:hypothetical protein